MCRRGNLPFGAGGQSVGSLLADQRPTPNLYPKALTLQFQKREPVVSDQRHQVPQLIHIYGLFEMPCLRRFMSAAAPVAMTSLGRAFRRYHDLGRFVVLIGHNPLCSG